MKDILDRICATKREHVSESKSRRPLPELQHDAGRAPTCRGFAAALARSVESGRYGLIAEIKRASPSRGLIRQDFEPAALARAYARGGAVCLSVLTDAPYFQGETSHLQQAHSAVDLPVLRKDFMLDPYQIVESRAIGADCVLLIMAALGDELAAELEAAAMEHGMDVLIEVHDEAELSRALRLHSRLIGINNRDLKTLDVEIGTTERLARLAPAEAFLICESGLRNPADLDRMSRAGVDCFLVGESLMSEPDVEAATRRLLAPPAATRASA